MSALEKLKVLYLSTLLPLPNILAILGDDIGPYNGIAYNMGRMGIADNIIVMYSTDNGVELALWPDGGYMAYRGEKNSIWEGGYRMGDYKMVFKE